MRAAICYAGTVKAWEASKSDGPFVCPGCSSTVILKQGMFVAPHFAHEPGAECEYATDHVGESEDHLDSKRMIFDALSGHKEVTDLKLERYLGSVRPDISFRYHKTPVALEVQISNIDTHTIIKRTREYARRGISLLWVSPWWRVEERGLQQGKLYVHMTAWERYIHYVLHHGRFYYWKNDLTFCSIHYQEEDAGFHSDPLRRMKHAAHRPMIEEDCQITSLSSFALGVNYTEEENFPLKAVFWGKPTVWVDEEKCFLPVEDAQQRYPLVFLDPARMVTPSFEGDPFDEHASTVEGLDLPPGAPTWCPLHKKPSRHRDHFGAVYCDDPGCWSRYLLLTRGMMQNYPEVIGVYDPRDYLPDRSQKPHFVPGPAGRMIAIYPARPPVTRTLIAAGEKSWREFAATQVYMQIAFALRMLENKG